MFSCRDKKSKILAKILLENPKKSRFDISITLACAIPKKAKIDYIIEKCTELGIDRIIPIITERTIVRFTTEKAENRHKRWQKISQEASKQCGRIKFPLIEQVLNFNKAIEKAGEYDLALIPNLEPKNKSLKDTIHGFSGKSIIAFIGPEGDFTKAEVELAKKNGCIGVSLGELVLKVDTAALGLTAFLRLGL